MTAARRGLRGAPPQAWRRPGFGKEALFFLDGNAVLVDAQFDALGLGFLAPDIDTEGDDGGDQCADDEIKIVLLHSVFVAAQRRHVYIWESRDWTVAAQAGH